MNKINLTIPKPCHEEWDQMTPADQGRFCKACQKTVIDFSSLSDQQLAAYFKKPIASVCGRFHQDQLERDLSIPTKRIPWLRYFFQIMLPAFLLSLKAQGQKNRTLGRVVAQSNIEGKGTKKQLSVIPTSKTITGQVKDGDGNPIPSASVMIKGTKQGVTTDTAGVFKLSVQQEFPFILSISSVGFETKECTVMDTLPMKLVLAPNQYMLAGEVVVISNVQRPKKAIPLMVTQKKDTAFNRFVVYPNPIRSNGNITIESKKLDKGTCLVQLTAMDGKIVCATSLVLARKGDLLRMDLPTLAPGPYLLSISNQTSQKVYTEKIQVQ